jgi:hypothetical protein
MEDIVTTIYDTLISKGYEDYGNIKFDIYPGDLIINSEKATALYVDEDGLTVDTEDNYYNDLVLAPEELEKVLDYVKNITDVKSGVCRYDGLKDETGGDEQEFMEINALGLAVVDGIQVFYTDWHFTDKVPEGYYKYEVRTADDSNKWCTLENSVKVNLGGTIISKTEFPLTDGYYNIQKYVILFEGD